MEAPYTIASLPKPLDGEHGRSHAAPVYGVRAGQKRKRHEVVVGVDGEGVNIYNVQNQSLVTSHALPPRTYMCCPPCSVYIRRPKPAGAQRRTYLILRDGPQDTKRRLVCLVEDVQGAVSSIDTPTGPRKHEVKLQDTSYGVLGVEVVPPAQSDRELQVLVTHRNGSQECFVGDLTSATWRESASGDEESKDIVEYTALFDIETAKRGLLASREDIFAAFDTSPSSSAQTKQLICRVMRQQGGERSLELFALRAAAVDALQSQQSNLQHLAAMSLPPANGAQGLGNAAFNVHAATGKVYQMLDGKLHVYDFSGTVPRFVMTIGSRADPVVSFTRASSASVLAVQGDRLVVYETRFGAVLESVSLNPSSTALVGLKRRRDRAAAISDNVLITNFQDLGLIAGLSGHELTSLQLPEDLRKPKRGQMQGSTLADVLGKGDGNIMSGKKPEDWKTSFVTAVGESNLAEIESHVATKLHMRGDCGQSLDSVSEYFDRARPGLRMDALPFDLGKVDKKDVLFIISQLFRPATEEEQRNGGKGRIVMTARSELSYKALALAGFLNVSNLDRAMRIRDQSLAAGMTRPGDIMTALKDYDGTFALLHEMLSSSIYWDVSELVQALRLLIRSLETPAEGTRQHYYALASAPTKDDAEKDEDTAMAETNGASDVGSHLETESALAQQELDLAISTLTHGVEFRSETIRSVLEKLTTFPSTSITKAMREMCTHDELLFFLKLLRIELLSGDWHRAYVSSPDEEEEQQQQEPNGASDDGPSTNVLPNGDNFHAETAPQPGAISLISRLMNCAIDAIGLSGWLVGQSGTASSDVYGTREFIKELRAEVSACAEGLFENDTVKVFLDEVAGMERSLSLASKMEKRKRIAAMEAGDLDEQSRVLPMGCRVEGTRVLGRNGKVGRSERVEMAEKRRRIGKYVFERIRI
ncbi:hypothetical protein LTR86_009124 [Recurvomyces mirabilis]|nr:hypothetical protein LTR86_009124 [Recurvomyces mirabilis]